MKSYETTTEAGKKKGFASIGIALSLAGLVLASTGIASVANAQTIPTTTTATAASSGAATKSRFGGHQFAPGVVGTVTAISGNTITLTDNTGKDKTTPVTYTVDATNAKVERL